jgi:hypothetical protein
MLAAPFREAARLHWRRFYQLETQQCVRTYHKTRRRELVDVRLRSLFAVWLVYCSLSAGRDAPKTLVRFFNDSSKAANF